jgi:hypothetical protein
MSKVTVINSMAIDNIHDFDSNFRSAVLNAMTEDGLNLMISNYLQELVSDVTFSLSRLFEGHISSFLLSQSAHELWLDHRYPYKKIFTQITPNMNIRMSFIDPEEMTVHLLIDLPLVDHKTIVTSMGLWKPELIIKNECFTTPDNNIILSVNLDHQQVGINNYTFFDSTFCNTKGTIVCPAEATVDLTERLQKNPLRNMSQRTKRGTSSNDDILATNLAKMVVDHSQPIMPHVPLIGTTDRVVEELTKLKQHIKENNDQINMMRDSYSGHPILIICSAGLSLLFLSLVIFKLIMSYRAWKRTEAIRNSMPLTFSKLVKSDEQN